MSIQKHNLRQVLTLLVAGLTLLLSTTSAAAAATTNSSSQSNSSNENFSQAITQSYNADSSVKLGMIVQLKNGDATTVAPLTKNGIANMLGVVVTAGEATATLTPQQVTQQQVFVATSGRYDVLVSNENGSIKAGDYITISSLDGTGMKADQDQAIILGKAIESFNGTSNVVSTSTITDSKGHTTRVSVGNIAVDINIARNPLISKVTNYIPNILSKTAVTVADRPVSAARIYLSLLTLLTSAVITASLLYSGIRNGMMAIGRNPLSKKSIIRSLMQTVTAGLIIFILGILAVYLLLKL